jgi:adenosylhomocysteine nucleosidase
MNKPVRIMFLLAVLIFSACSCQPATPSKAKKTEPVIAILGAFDAEIKLLENNVTNKQELYVSGIRFVSGDLKGRKIILSQSGVGKVNAAMVASITISSFHPRELVFSGIAGGINPELHPGDIVIGEKIFQHDYGVIGNDGFKIGPTKNLSKKPNPLIFTVSPKLVEIASQAANEAGLAPLAGSKNGRTPKIIPGTIATGDVFVASEAKCAELRKLGADAVEMEGGAVAQVCSQYGVNFIVIRSLSDRADKNAEVDIEKFYQIAADNSAKLVMAIVARMPK